MKAVEIVQAEKIDFLPGRWRWFSHRWYKIHRRGRSFNENDPWEIITSYGSVVKQALPFGCVLTLAATRSEMNNYGCD